MDVTATEARRQAVAAPVTNIAHAVIGTLPTLTTIVALAVIIIEVVGALAPDRDLLTVIDTTDLVAGLEMMIMTELETEARDVNGLVVESELQVRSANHRPPSPLRTNETEGPFLCNNLLLG